MSKSDNLTDFLTSLANKIRSLSGENAPINPQDFEAKLDEIYSMSGSSGALPVGREVFYYVTDSFVCND